MKSFEVKALGLEELQTPEIRTVEGGGFLATLWAVVTVVTTIYGAADIVSDFIAGWNSVDNAENNQNNEG